MLRSLKIIVIWSYAITVIGTQVSQHIERNRNTNQVQIDEWLPSDLVSMVDLPPTICVSSYVPFVRSV